MKKYFLYILPIIFVAGCVSITSKYPPIEYYKLEQEPISAKNIGRINATLMIRNITVSSDLDNDHLLAVWDKSRIQRYYYHRWLSDCSDMITDFFVTRFSKTEAFIGGVVKSSSWIVPDYILEGNVEEMTAYSTEGKNPNENYSYISLQITLARRSPMTVQKEVIFTDNYTQKIFRPDNSVKSIVPAFDKAFSQVADKILLDVQSAIGIDRMKNNIKE